MKKLNSFTICMICAGCLVFCFFLSILLDASRRTAADSAPFWAVLLARAIMFLLPALVCLLFGFYFRWKAHKAV